MLYSNIKEIIQVSTDNKPKRGQQMNNLPRISDAYIRTSAGKITEIGSMADLQLKPNENIHDCQGRIVIPSFCDSHTHLVFARSREEDYVMRIEGKSYEEIAENGGGILNSAKVLQETEEEFLYESAKRRLDEVIKFGTGAIEIKSGYGLTFDAEMKMLRVIKRLKEASPIPIKSTFLGAHAIPSEYQDNREAYIDIVCNEMIPYVAKNKLADYCDVFCDKGFFTPDETLKICSTAAQHGMEAKIHANELANSGGVQVGIELGARSVDHLEQIGKEEIELLGKNDIAATVLPGCSFFLGIPYAPARTLIGNNAILTLASDYNPGSSPSGKMPFVVSLACTKMKLLPDQALAAATINGAWAMELHDEVGSIQVGKRANFLILKEMRSFNYFPYAHGSDSIEKVVINGEIIN